MQPVVKRILIQGGLTAVVLALIGLALAEVATLWTAGHAGKPNSADLNPPPPADLRYRIPLTLAAGGFVFVAVGEWITARLRARKAAANPAPPQPDEAEKLLNELLAQAEAKNSPEQGSGGSIRDSAEEPKATDEPQAGGGEKRAE